MADELKGKRYSDLLVLWTYRVGNRLWARTQCLRTLEGGKTCNGERHVEVKRLRQTRACERCSGVPIKGQGQGKRNETRYPNGLDVVTPENYRKRFWDLTLQQRAEVLRIIHRNELTDEDEWEAVEQVVMEIGVERQSVAPVGWSTDYSWLYRG